MTLYYIIPAGANDYETLSAGQVGTSSAVQPGSSESTVKVVVQASKACTVVIQHSKTSGGPWLSHEPDGTTLDAEEQTLYYYLPTSYYIRVVITNTSGVDNNVKAWIDTDTDAVYCSPSGVYTAAGIDSSIISHDDTMRAIVRATGEVDLLTQRIWNQRTVTETFNGDNTPIYFTEYYPIQSVTSLTVNSTSITTTELRINTDTGKIELSDDADPEVARYYQDSQDREKNSITYVAGPDSIPAYIVGLTEALAAVMILTEQTGGTYDDPTSWTIGSRTVSVGEPWVNIENTMKRLQKRIDSLLKNIPKGVYIP